MPRITIDGNSVVHRITGYRLAIGLQPLAQAFSVFQVLCEEFSAYGPAAGFGRTAPTSLLGGVELPANDVAVPVLCQRPNAPGANLTHDMQLQNCMLKGVDRRVQGENSITLLTFHMPIAGITRPTSPAIMALTRNSAGEIDLLGNGTFIPVLDIDSSLEVLSIRHFRNIAVDVVQWLVANAGLALHLGVHYRFNNGGNVQGLPTIAGGVNVQKGIIFEEVCGRFADMQRTSAAHWKSAFAGAGFTINNLTLSLEDVLPLPIGQQALPLYNPGGNVEERLSIVFHNDIDFPNW